jgi:hypothetical protein
MRLLAVALAVALVADDRYALAQQLPNPQSLVTIPPIVIVTTGTAVCFGNQQLANGLIVTAQHVVSTVLTANTNTIWVGGPGVAIGQGDGLAPGGRDSAGVTNASGVCINGTAGDGATGIGN